VPFYLTIIALASKKAEKSGTTKKSGVDEYKVGAALTRFDARNSTQRELAFRSYKLGGIMEIATSNAMPRETLAR